LDAITISSIYYIYLYRTKYHLSFPPNILSKISFRLLSLVSCLFIIESLDVSASSNGTSSSGGNETDLSTRGSVSADGRGNTDMLLVTTTEGMVNGIHGNSSNSRPSLSESLHLVVNSTSLKDRLIDSFSGGNQTNHGSSVTSEGLSGTRGKLDSGLAKIIGVTDDGSGGTGASGQFTLITRLGFDVTDGSTFGDLVDGEDVTGGEGSFMTAVNVLSSVHAFDSQEVGSLESILIRISESNSGEGSTTAGIVEDLSDDTLDVTVLLSEIENSESSGGDSVVLVGLED